LLETWSPDAPVYADDIQIHAYTTVDEAAFGSTNLLQAPGKRETMADFLK